MLIRKVDKQNLGSKELRDHFINGTLMDDHDFFMDEYYDTGNYEMNYFNPYVGRGKSTKKDQIWLNLIRAVSEVVEGLPASLYEDGNFWFSLFLTRYQLELINDYPELKSSSESLKDILLKKFGWENYIYKAIIIAKLKNYAKKRFGDDDIVNYILDDLDLFNYLIKTSLFRNLDFISNIFELTRQNAFDVKLKSQIKSEKFNKIDIRFARRIVYELNKAYPVLFVQKFELQELGIKMNDIIKQYQ